MPQLIEPNPALDRAAARRQFEGTGRAQIADFLTEPSARALFDLLDRGTPWGLAWQAGESGPQLVRSDRLSRLEPAEVERIQSAIVAAGRGRDYAFAYLSYPLVKAYLERWSPASAHETLLEELNSPELLDVIREVTGIAEIVKMDGQATLYGPGHFLSLHNDEEEERGRRVAYVLGMASAEWRPDWGGYLNFFDDKLDVEQALRPRFNTLNLFRVPQMHSVSQVAAFCPAKRLAVTGWARDR